MVKEIECTGQIVNVVFRKMGIDQRNYRAIYFKQDGNDDHQIIKEISVLRELSEDYPSFFRSSLLFKGGVSANGSKLHTLLVPLNCPLLAIDLETRFGGEPDETMTYLVEAKRPFGCPTELIWPVYSENCDEAAIIARKTVSRQNGWIKRDLTLFPSLVSPDDFCKQAKNLIEQGFRLPAAVLWIRDLRSFAIEMQSLGELRQPRIVNI